MKITKYTILILKIIFVAKIIKNMFFEKKYEKIGGGATYE